MNKKACILIGVLCLAVVSVAFSPSPAPTVEYKFERADGGGDLGPAGSRATKLAAQGWRLVSASTGVSIQGRQELVLAFTRTK